MAVTNEEDERIQLIHKETQLIQLRDEKTELVKNQTHLRNSIQVLKSRGYEHMENSTQGKSCIKTSV